MLGGNLGSFLYGDVSVMTKSQYIAYACLRSLFRKFLGICSVSSSVFVVIILYIIQNIQKLFTKLHVMATVSPTNAWEKVKQHGRSGDTGFL